MHTNKTHYHLLIYLFTLIVSKGLNLAGPGAGGRTEASAPQPPGLTRWGVASGLRPPPGLLCRLPGECQHPAVDRAHLQQ